MLKITLQQESGFMWAWSVCLWSVCFVGAVNGQSPLWEPWAGPGSKRTRWWRVPRWPLVSFDPEGQRSCSPAALGGTRPDRSPAQTSKTTVTKPSEKLQLPPKVFLHLTLNFLPSWIRCRPVFVYIPKIGWPDWLWPRNSGFAQQVSFHFTFPGVSTPRVIVLRLLANTESYLIWKSGCLCSSNFAWIST